MSGGGLDLGFAKHSMTEKEIDLWSVLSQAALSGAPHSLSVPVVSVLLKMANPVGPREF